MMTDDTIAADDTAWHLRHYAAAGKSYGDHHFTQADSRYARWILDQIESVRPEAETLAEIGAGTCVFASLLGERLPLKSDVVCYEPVGELLEGAAEFDNVEAVNGDAAEFARSDLDGTFDLIFTKDTAHHFPEESLDTIHRGICKKLRPGGRYLMVVRTPPNAPSVPVGDIARAKWQRLYTPLSALLRSLRGVAGWREVQVDRWQLSVETRVDDWLEGIRNQNAWSIFSALDSQEIAATVDELNSRFNGRKLFDFLHQYNVAVFERHSDGPAGR